LMLGCAFLPGKRPENSLCYTTELRTFSSDIDSNYEALRDNLNWCYHCKDLHHPDCLEFERKFPGEINKLRKNGS
jgi:hypothetical protein